MSKLTYRLNRFAFYDRERIQKYLEAMAQKGWILDKTGATLWRYRKETPRRIHVSILYVADGSDYNPKPTNSEELLEELSLDSGWHLLSRWDQMQIFYNEQENPTPLETDPVTQVEAIHRCMKKDAIPKARQRIIYGLLMAALMLFQLFTSPIDYLSQGAWFWFLPGSVVIAITGAISLISWHIWYNKASFVALGGQYVSVWNARLLNIVLNICCWILTILMFLSFSGRLGFIVLCFLPVILVIIFVKWLTKTMKETGVKSEVNKRTGIFASVILTMVLLALISFIGIKYHMINASKPIDTYQVHDMEFDVFADSIPIHVEDLMETDIEKWSTEDRTQESFLIANHHYRQWPLTQEDAHEIDYQVIDIKVPFVYDLCKNDLLDSQKDTVKHGEVIFVNHFEPIDPGPWGAREAYQEIWDNEFSSQYIICYEDKLIMLNSNWDLTADQMAIVGKTFS